MSLRHSLLPKLAVQNGGCSCFVSAGGTSPAAQRGTDMDTAYRKAIEGNTTLLDQLNAKDKTSVEWAIERTRAYSMSDELIVDEARLKNRTSLIDHTGTEDARIPSRQTSLDLKTGQMRNYREQMAAYALGNMESHFVDSWTCILLFADLQIEVIHEFTHDQAKAMIVAIVSAYNDPNKKPSACDYCGWCAKKDTCPAVVGPVVESLAVVESVEGNLADIRHQLISSPERLGKFLKAANIFKKELWDYAKDYAKKQMSDGVDVSG